MESQRVHPSLSVMFFASGSADDGGDRYALVRAAAAAADRLGYEAVWLPERHFDAFGGLFPNPALLAASLAPLTRTCHLRAGSVVAPLHDALRIAEDWSVLDNLTGGGRVGVSLGSGWNTNDFVLAPDRYADRAERTRAAVHELRALWAGGRVARANGSGRTVEVGIQPPPLSRELPLWLTASGNPDTFRAAGRLGANVLTHLLGQDADTLADKIALYRAARADANLDPRTGRVTLMLHALATDDDAQAWAMARRPLRAYLRSALDLELRAASGGGAVSGGRRLTPAALSEAVIDELLDERARRFYAQASLLGTVDKCRDVLDRVGRAGVDEVACLVDFGAPHAAVLAGLERLAHAFIAPPRRTTVAVGAGTPSA